jgi:hypothetical protein
MFSSGAIVRECLLDNQAIFLIFDGCGVDGFTLK